MEVSSPPPLPSTMAEKSDEQLFDDEDYLKSTSSTTSSSCDEMEEALDIYLDAPDSMMMMMDDEDDGGVAVPDVRTVSDAFMDPPSSSDGGNAVVSSPIWSNPSGTANAAASPGNTGFPSMIMMEAADHPGGGIGRFRQVSDSHSGSSPEAVESLVGSSHGEWDDAVGDGHGNDVVGSMAMGAASAAEPKNPPTMTGRFPILLYLSCNPDYLSPYQCLVRKQIQLFEAGPTDVDAVVKGRNRPVVLGQVGIQCFHCAGVVPPTERARGAVYYPHTLKGIYQAAQILSATHLLDACSHIPLAVKEELQTLKQQRTSNNAAGKDYWATTAATLGVYEDEYGLRFTPFLGGYVCPTTAAAGGGGSGSSGGGGQDGM